MKKFFMAIGWDGESIIEHPYYLISSATCFKGDRFKIPKLKTSPKEIFLDSGGFSLFTKYEKYPFSIEEYLAFIEKFCSEYPQTKYVAVMDYPCEPQVNRKSLTTNKQRIHETIKNARCLLKQKIPAEWVMVIQGHELHEYFYCMEQIQQERLWTNLTAVGSICRRKQCGQIFQILNTINRFRPGQKIHAFGIELQAIYDRTIWDMVYSCDSGAWKFNHESRRNGNWKPESLEDKKRNFEIYRQKIDTLFNDRNGNCQLIDYRFQNLTQSIDGIGHEIR